MQRLSLAAMLLLSLAAISHAQDKPGTPITSGVGLAETTAQIMARQATTNVIASPRFMPRLRPTLHRQSNANTLPEELAAAMGKSTRASVKVAQVSVPRRGGEGADRVPHPAAADGAPVDVVDPVHVERVLERGGAVTHAVFEFGVDLHILHCD